MRDDIEGFGPLIHSADYCIDKAQARLSESVEVLKQAEALIRRTHKISVKVETRIAADVEPLLKLAR